MGALSRRTSSATLSIAAVACLVAAGLVAACGFAIGLFAGSIGSTTSDISAVASIDLRFPAEWAENATPSSYASASAEATVSLFDPEPVYPVALETTASVSGGRVAAQQGVAAAQAAPAPVKLAAAAAVRAVRRSNAVLNESQIASIKRRLNLTAEQERYWPAVEAELRKMEYQKDPKAHGIRTASIDMTKVNVAGLKTAGLPLVMSFNEDQKQEFRSLAHLLGLENVMSTF